MQVYCHILTWNDARYLPELFASFENQSLKNFHIRILDNGSSDKTLSYLAEHAPHTLVGRNVKNLGFDEGHNQLIRFTLEHKMSSDQDAAVLIMNSDVILGKDLIKNLCAALETHPDWAVVQPKIYRAFGEKTGDESIKETVLSDILDSTGLRVQKGWRMTDRGAGEMDHGQYNEEIDLFGPTGAMFLIRLSVLEKIMMDRDFFDSDFFAYREDCDLAWRMRAMGYRTGFVPTAIAHHYRGMYGAEHQGLWQRLKNRRNQRPFFAALSTRNQILMLLKNLAWSDFFLSLPWLFFGEGSRVLYGFLFEGETRHRLLGIPKLLPAILKKRKWILSQRTVENRELRAYVR
jgi:GT2 family glycosyltransferase